VKPKTIGVAVDIKVAHEQPPTVKIEEDEDPIQPEGSAKWDVKPQFLDQYFRQELWREGVRFTSVFNLVDPEELAKWNAEQGKMYPVSSPMQVLLAEPVVHEVGGKLILVATFQKIEYKQVI